MTWSQCSASLLWILALTAAGILATDVSAQGLPTLRSGNPAMQAPQQAMPGALRIEFATGAQLPDGSLDLAATGLGRGGLLPRESWAESGKLMGRGRFESRGGLRFEVRNGGCAIACPNGQRFDLDGLGRLSVEGRVLTEYAQLGLCLRFHDGTELRLQPGRAKAARSISVVLGDIEYLLAIQGRPQAGRKRAGPSQGLRWYLCGDGDEIVSLVAVGPMLLLRPVLVRKRSKQPRLLMLGDVARVGLQELLAGTPKNRIQYPNARKVARFLASLGQRLFPPKKRLQRVAHSMAQQPIRLGFGPDIHWDLLPYGQAGWGGLSCSFRLATNAEASAEFVAQQGQVTLYRVLPVGRQRRTRYLGAGLPFKASFEKLLPWKMPLSNFTQRKLTLESFEAWLPRQQIHEANWKH